jgi:hypothetical protein
MLTVAEYRRRQKHRALRHLATWCFLCAALIVIVWVLG